MTQQLSRFSVPISVVMRGRPQDPRRLRERFLQTPPDQIQTFLEEFGVESEWETADEVAEWQTIIRHFLRLKNWSDLEARMMRRGLTEKFQEAGSRIFYHLFHFRIDAGRWSAELDTDDSALQVLLLSVVLEKLEGNQFAVCNRKKCGQVFPSRPGKLYCSPECAHFATVKAGREKNRRALVQRAAAELTKRRKGGPWHEDAVFKSHLAERVNVTPKWLTRHRTEIERQRKRKGL